MNQQVQQMCNSINKITIVLLRKKYLKQILFLFLLILNGGDIWAHTEVKNLENISTQTNLYEVASEIPDTLRYNIEYTSYIQQYSKKEVVFNGIAGNLIKFGCKTGNSVKIINLVTPSGITISSFNWSYENRFILPETGYYSLQIEAKGSDYVKYDYSYYKFWLYQLNPPTESPDTLNYNIEYTSNVKQFYEKKVVFKGTAGILVKFGCITGNSVDMIHMITPSGDTISSFYWSYENKFILPETGYYSLLIKAKGSDYVKYDYSYYKFWLYQLNPPTESPDTLNYNVEYTSSVKQFYEKKVVFKGTAGILVKFGCMTGNSVDMIHMITPSGDTISSFYWSYENKFILPETGYYSLLIKAKGSDYVKYDYSYYKFWLYQLDPPTEIPDTLNYKIEYASSIKQFYEKKVVFNGTAGIRLKFICKTGNSIKIIHFVSPSGDTLSSFNWSYENIITLPETGQYSLLIKAKGSDYVKYDYSYYKFWINELSVTNRTPEILVNEIKTNNLNYTYETAPYKFKASQGDTLILRAYSTTSSFTPQLYFITPDDSLEIITGQKGKPINQQKVIEKDGYYGLLFCGAESHSSINYTIQVLEASIPKGILSWDYGNGSEVSPWEIHNLSDLLKLSLYTAYGQKFEGKYFQMMDNIDLKGKSSEISQMQWIPIGGRDTLYNSTMDNYFSGSFSGNNYVLSNIYINNTSKNLNGVFGYLKGATVQNLGVIGECEINGGANTGTIAGFVNNSSFITNCYSSIASGRVNENGAGGSGGIAGALFGGSVVSNCYNKSKVEGKNFMGGIAGWVQDGSLINNCYNTENIESRSGQGIGGLAGLFSGSTISNCYNTGSITGKTSAGAIAGQETNGTVLNTYYNSTTSNQSKAVGSSSGTSNLNITGMTTTEMQKASFVDLLNQGQSAAWSQDKTPQINNGYPLLISNSNINTIVISSSPTLIYSFGADLNGYVYVGKNKVLSYGFEFKPKSATQYTRMESTLNGVFLKTEASGLVPGSEYTYRAFAVTSSDTIFAEPINFSTPKCAVLTYTRKVGNDGKNTLKFSGNGFHENVVVKLAKAGRDTLVSEMVSAERYNCSALFDFTKKEIGYWDIIVDFKGISIQIKNGLEIEETIQGELKIEIVGNNRVLIGRNTDYTIKLTNTGNTQISSPTVVIQIKSSDKDLKASTDIYSDDDKELFNYWELDPNDFTFTDTGDLDGNGGTSKTGTFFGPDLTAYQSKEIVVKLKTNKNMEINAWQSDYSYGQHAKDMISTYINNASNTETEIEEICNNLYKDCYKDYMGEVGNIIWNDLKDKITDEILDNIAGRIFPGANLNLDEKAAKYLLSNSRSILEYGQNMTQAAINGNDPEYLKQLSKDFVKDKVTGMTSDYIKGIGINQINNQILHDAFADGTINNIAKSENIPLWDAFNKYGKESLDFLKGKYKLVEWATYLGSYGIVGALNHVKAQKMCNTNVLKDCEKHVNAKLNVRAVSSFDPNDKIGYRSPSGSTYFNDKRNNFTYIINFENKSSATAPAHEVFITDTLDMKSFNVSSFRAGYIKIGEIIAQAPYNAKNHKWEVDLRPKRDIKVEVSITLDSIKGIAKWYFKTFDPATNDLPSDPDMGFLQPNDSTGRGQGSVSFTIDLNESVTDDVEVNNRATIVFDYNSPIVTPTWSNKKDIITPTSYMYEPEILNENIANISWAGEDNENGAGVYCFNVFMKKGNNDYTQIFNRTTSSSFDFEYEMNENYSFYVTAIDSAENAEIKTNVPDIVFSPKPGQEQDFTVTIIQKWEDVLICNNTDNYFDSYQWYKNDVAIAGETKQFYQENGGLNGSYYVQVSTTDGKIGVSNIIEVGNNAKSVKVFPNPSEESQDYTVEVYANQTELSNGTLVITNVNGQIVSQRSSLESQMKLNGLTRGIYMVQVRFTNGETFNNKLIVK